MTYFHVGFVGNDVVNEANMRVTDCSADGVADARWDQWMGGFVSSVFLLTLTPDLIVLMTRGQHSQGHTDGTSPL